MKTTIVTCLAFAALSLAACTDETDTPEDPTEPIAEARAEIVDASRIHPLGPMQRPTAVFDPVAALTLSNIAGTQVGSEGLVATATLGSSLQRARSASWEVFRRPATGDLQVVGREELWTPPVEDPSVDPQALKAAAAARLTALGMPSSEVLVVLQKQTNMIASEDMASRLHAHVTHFQRGFNGIPARGSHASVIHDRAGQFSKLLLHWRPVAPDATGNQWGTSMTPEQITARANQVLVEQGLGERAAQLRYAYVPSSLNDDGTTTFALKCVAHVSGLPQGHPDGQDRPVEIPIDLDP